MFARTRRCLVLALAISALLGTTACRNSGALSATPTAAAVADPWTTPPAPGSTYLARPADVGSLQPAPRAVTGTTTWTGSGMPPPPPPPDGSLPVVGQPSTVVCPPVCPPAVAPAPVGRRLVRQQATYSGCGLPCASGISQWHVRALGGLPFHEGDDTPEDCGYLGVDVGRTFCGCWGLDAYYRWNDMRFDHWHADGTFFKDRGKIHHAGLKLTYESGFGQNSRWYGWAGLGGGYFWANNFHEADDSGPEIFGEAGIGYVISKNWRARAGVNIHGYDTDVSRLLPADLGRSRWIWTIAPIIGVEVDF